MRPVRSPNFRRYGIDTVSAKITELMPRQRQKQRQRERQSLKEKEEEERRKKKRETRV
jgi:hypothetical protein